MLSGLQTLSAKFNSVRARLVTFWQSLNVAQRCYLMAIVVSFIYFQGDGQDTTLMLSIAILTLVAMVSEFWPRFIHIWDSLPGKALILLFYAFVANYALVQASGMVNDITGVSADHLPYTHNFSALLSIPIWFFVTSLVVLLVIQISIPVYLFILLILRPFGLHTMWHPPGYRFPITTGIVRFGAGFFLLIQLGLLATYTGTLNGVSTTLSNIVEGLEINLTINDKRSPEQQKTQELAQDPELNSELAGLTQLAEQSEQRSQAYEDKIKQIIAHFIYENEADSRSRCEHTPQSRVIELNDYEILEISKSPNARDDALYTYTVKPCISAAIGHQFKSHDTIN